MSKYKIVVAYVEYFSAYKFIILLSDSYSGIDNSITYRINPITGREIDIDIKIDLNKEDILKIINDKPNYAEMRSSICRVVNFFQNRAWEEEKHRVIKKAVLHAFKEVVLKEGDTIELEHIAKLSNATTEKMIPFLLHMFKGHDELKRGPSGPYLDQKSKQGGCMQ